MRNRFLRSAGVTLAVMLFVSSVVKADEWSTGFTLSNQTVVNVQYTDPNSSTLAQTSTPEQTWAVPFTMTDTTGGTLPIGTTFTGFCVDLYHNVQNGQTTTDDPGFVSVAGAQGAGVNSAGITASPFPNFSAYTTDLGSKLNYLGSLYNQIQGTASTANDAYVLGAVQLAVWTLLDAQFKVTGEATGMANDLATILKLIGPTATNGSGGGSVTFDTYGGTGSGTVTGVSAYYTGSNYSGAEGQVLLVQTSAATTSSPIQNVITWSGEGTTSVATPEPSTFAIAGLGALGFLGYGWKRRKRS